MDGRPGSYRSVRVKKKKGCILRCTKTCTSFGLVNLIFHTNSLEIIELGATDLQPQKFTIEHLTVLYKVYILHASRIKDTILF